MFNKAMFQQHLLVSFLIRPLSQTADKFSSGNRDTEVPSKEPISLTRPRLQKGFGILCGKGSLHVQFDWLILAQRAVGHPPMV
jgi:hypothetical protein